MLKGIFLSQMKQSTPNLLHNSPQTTWLGRSGVVEVVSIYRSKVMASFDGFFPFHNLDADSNILQGSTVSPN